MSIVNKISRILDGETKMGHCEMIVAILAATGLTEAQLEGLANGTHTVVPVEPTRAMLDAWFRTLILRRPLDECYRAMLAAKEGT